jgi:multidrug transporter EmrE-like cation transporter
MWKYLYFLLYFIVTTSGLSLMKQSSSILSTTYLVGTVLFGVGYLVFSLVIIRSLPLSIGFPVASSGLIIGTQVAGFFFLGETTSWPQIFAITMIVAGVSILAIIQQN